MQGLSSHVLVMGLLVLADLCVSADDARAQGSADMDRAALVALYNATDGANWTDNTNWLSDEPLATWYGVATDENGRVTELDLESGNLSGTLPTEIGNLGSLQRLELVFNDLTGELPAEIGDLDSLQWLVLTFNDLTGEIPTEIGDLANLRELGLGGNRLTGEIPTELGDLTNLTDLRLWSNRLTGEIPTELADLSSLEVLDLGGNRLTGPIPPELGSTSLRCLALWYNDLTGGIPTELGNLTNLTELELHRNNLTGEIPTELGNLTRLWELNLNGNLLTGSIPSEVADLARLGSLDLAFNEGLTGPVPSQLRLRQLETLDLAGTALCMPADTEFQTWLTTIDELRSSGLTCGEPEPEISTIDVAVFYTPAARTDAGGTAEIETSIDLMVAEANKAYADSGVSQQIALVTRQEIEYTERDQNWDLNRLENPSDGYLDEVHAIRDEVGADLVHLLPMVGDNDYTACGKGFVGRPFALTGYNCGGLNFAHELGHDMGLNHDRYALCGPDSFCVDWPFRYGYGYVNPQGLESGAAESARWFTIMAYGARCSDSDVHCEPAPRFSNPDQTWKGDPLGVAGDSVSSDVDGPANAAGVLDFMRHSMASLREPATNQAPTTTSVLPDRTLRVGGDTVEVSLEGVFHDPDGDALTYQAASSAPTIVMTGLSGEQLTLNPISAGTATVEVTATDIDGSNTIASLMFAVTVQAAAAGVLPVLPPGGVEPRSDGLFAPRESRAHTAVRDAAVTLRRREVSIDLGRLGAAPAAAWSAGPPALTLNLFDDVVLTGIVERRTPTFSGGYALSGRLAGIESGTMTLVVNGNLFTGTVRTPSATYRIRPAGTGRHAITRIDPSQLLPGDDPVLPWSRRRAR